MVLLSTACAPPSGEKAWKSWSKHLLPCEKKLNALFKSYLKHYWKLRVRLRLFGSLSEHLLDLHVAPYVIGDGVLKKRRSG